MLFVRNQRNETENGENGYSVESALILDLRAHLPSDRRVQATVFVHGRYHKIGFRNGCLPLTREVAKIFDF